jgi:hypothetical protein
MRQPNGYSILRITCAKPVQMLYSSAARQIDMIFAVSPEANAPSKKRREQLMAQRDDMANRLCDMEVEPAYPIIATVATSVFELQ